MPKLPHPPAEKLIKLLTNNGFEIVGRKGSHIRLKKKTDQGTYIRFYEEPLPAKRAVHKLSQLAQ